jgi:hypothetical protein
MSDWTVDQQNRRGLLRVAAAAGATLVMPRLVRGAADQAGKTEFGGDLALVRAAIEKQRPQAIKRLWGCSGRSTAPRIRRGWAMDFCRRTGRVTAPTGGRHKEIGTMDVLIIQQGSYARCNFSCTEDPRNGLLEFWIGQSTVARLSRSQSEQGCSS